MSIDELEMLCNRLSSLVNKRSKLARENQQAGRSNTVNDTVGRRNNRLKCGSNTRYLYIKQRIRRTYHV